MSICGLDIDLYPVYMSLEVSAQILPLASFGSIIKIGWLDFKRAPKFQLEIEMGHIYSLSQSAQTEVQCTCSVAECTLHYI